MPPIRTGQASSLGPITSPKDHPTLFFPDGDLFLLSSITSPTNQRTRFSVHKNILAAVHSSVFKDMFRSAADDGTTVKLEDSASSIASLLCYMYSGTNDIKSPTITNLCAAAPAGATGTILPVVETLRIADKYNVRGLHEYLEDAINRELLYWAQGVGKIRQNGAVTGCRYPVEQYKGSLKFGDSIIIYAYAVKLNKHNMKRTAMCMSYWLLRAHRQQLNKQDLTAYGLSPSAELTLWKHHYGPNQRM